VRHWLSHQQLAADTALRLELGRRALKFAVVEFRREAVLGATFGAVEGEVPGITSD